jgi:hypothetical protein
MISEEDTEELRAFCEAVREMHQGGEAFLYLEGLRLPPERHPAKVDALLCLHHREGYSTRLYLSARIADRGANWTVVYLLDRQWHTWSWQGVTPNQRAAQVLAGHLKALQ